MQNMTGRRRWLLGAAVVALLLVAFGAGAELGGRSTPPAAPAEPVIVVEYETSTGQQSERISVQAPEALAREIFQTVVDRR